MVSVKNHEEKQIVLFIGLFVCFGLFVSFQSNHSSCLLHQKSLEERFNLHFQFTGGHKNKTKKVDYKII